MKRPTDRTAPRDIAVAAPPAITLWWLWGPMLLILSIDPLIRVFAGKLPAQMTFDSLGPLLILPLIGLGLGAFYRRRRITLAPDQLDIVSTFYRKQVPLSSLRMDRARVVSFDEYPEFKPLTKTNGFQLPDFRSGHFRMGDGSKSFCLITDNQHVLVLPLRDGSTVLVSPEKPRALLDELKQLADSRPRA